MSSPAQDTTKVYSLACWRKHLLLTVSRPSLNRCSMRSFETRFEDTVGDSGKKGWLVAILELGAWVGVLLTGEQYPTLLGRCAPC